MREICPYAKICLVHENWEEQTGDKKIDIIVKETNQHEYNCLALAALDDKETGIRYGFNIEERIKDKTSLVCSH